MDAARDTQFPIILIGEGPLRNYAEAYEGTCVTGWLSRPEIVAVMEQARCLVFPSLWYETFGLVVEEAAARGIPAIVSDISAPAERIIPGVTGWRVSAGDVVDLTRCLQSIKDDEVVRRAGIASYNRYWENPMTPAHSAYPRFGAHLSGNLIARPWRPSDHTSSKEYRIELKGPPGPRSNKCRSNAPKAEANFAHVIQHFGH